MSRNKELKFHAAKFESISRRLHSVRAMTNVGQVGFVLARKGKGGVNGHQGGAKKPTSCVHIESEVWSCSRKGAIAQCS